MGGGVSDVGAVPTPTKTLKQQRADLIAAFSAALDNCIVQSETNTDYKDVPTKKLTADISFEYPKGAIKVRLDLDLSQNIFTQVNKQVPAIDADATQPPTDAAIQTAASLPS
jgi:hypothetical protein